MARIRVSSQATFFMKVLFPGAWVGAFVFGSLLSALQRASDAVFPLFIAFGSHLAFYGALKEREADLPPFPFVNSLIFLLELEYLASEGSHRNARLDRIARTTLIAPCVGLASCLAGFLILELAH